MFNQYLDRLKKFVTVEIVNRQTETVTANKTKPTTTATNENATPLKETENVPEEANTSTISSISLTSANEKLL